MKEMLFAGPFYLVHPTTRKFTRYRWSGLRIVRTIQIYTCYSVLVLYNPPWISQMDYELFFDLFSSLSGLNKDHVVIFYSDNVCSTVLYNFLQYDRIFHDYGLDLVFIFSPFVVHRSWLPLMSILPWHFSSGYHII